MYKKVAKVLKAYNLLITDNDDNGRTQKASDYLVKKSTQKTYAVK